MLYPKFQPEKPVKKHRYRVDYDLVYDGGGTAWSGYYRTYVGARISAFFHVHLRSWGGSAILFDTSKE